MVWRKVALAPAEVAAGKHVRLQDEFAAIFMALGGPRDAGMFGSLAADASDYFFSPGAVRIAGPMIDRYAGAECPAPRLSEVALLVVSNGGDFIPFSSES
jgi:hypothetical protein